MPCTTILVGKLASYDGSTLMARNEDSGSKSFDPKRFIAVTPEQQPRQYKSVLSGFEITLPENPLRYTAVPNAIPDEGIWGEAGINEKNVAMTETETITSNARVQGADPLAENGFGEEDMLTIVLPYIHSAREGVERLGALLEQYGTYEMNAVGFQDREEIWWLETIGGHHWIAKRVPDDSYVVAPNQQGIDSFDFVDAFSERRNHMCSSDMVSFVEDNHLDLSSDGIPVSEATEFDARAAFGSRADSDHSYNTPRAWYMERYFNPRTFTWDGPLADYSPESDDIPWSMVPEKKITIEDVKYILSSYYQGTDYNPYSKHADPAKRGMYRSIGVNRNNFVAVTQIRPYVPAEIAAVEWIAEGSNAFNAAIPFYGNINGTPAYLRDVGARATTENFYWANRIIAALADAHFAAAAIHVERYQNLAAARGHLFLKETDRRFMEEQPQDVPSWLEKRNEELCQWLKEQTGVLLDHVLYEGSLEMKNAFARSDA